MALTAEQSAAVSSAWAANLQGGVPQPSGAAAAVGIDPKKILCDDWPTAKTVLQALQQFLPQPGPIIIGVIIAGGDAAYKHFCGGGG